MALSPLLLLGSDGKASAAIPVPMALIRLPAGRRNVLPLGMSAAQPVEFTLDPGRPAVLRVTMPDGTVYETELTVVVSGVIDLGGRNPDGTHRVEIQAGVQLHSKQVPR